MKHNQTMSETPASVSPAFIEGYSRENAEAFGWSSISGELNPERVRHLKNYICGQKVLDAGCGGGAYTDFLVRSGFETTGTDYHQRFLEVAEERGYAGTFVQADILALPFADKLFDCAFCFDVLEHVDDVRGIAELARVTKQRLLIAVPRENAELQEYNLTFLHYRDKTHLRNYTEDSLMALAQTIHPRRIQVIPELPVPTPELVRFLTRPEIAALRIRLEELLQISEWESIDFAALTGEQQPIVTPSIPRAGIRSRLKAWAVEDPFVQDIFRREYGAVFSRLYRQSFRAFLQQRLDAGFADFIEQTLHQATFAKIYTGLVAVVDL